MSEQDVTEQLFNRLVSFFPPTRGERAQQLEALLVLLNDIYAAPDLLPRVTQALRNEQLNLICRQLHGGSGSSSDNGLNVN